MNILYLTKEELEWQEVRKIMRKKRKKELLIK